MLFLIVSFIIFSTENWNRPKREIDFLFNLLENFLSKKLDDLHNQNIKLKILGKKNFSIKLNKLLELAEKKNIKKHQTSNQLSSKLWFKI